MAQERKSFPFEFKMNKEKRTLEGYASTFNNKDLVGDIVVEGAFRKTLQERGPAEGRKSRVKLLWQHNPYMPLGLPLKMAEDSKGLEVEAYISKTTLGDDAIAFIEDGVLDSLSIGYDVLQDDYKSDTGTRYLKELKLYEFSLVTFPANEEATIGGLKNYDQLSHLLDKTANFDVTRLLKEGRTLSKANSAKIKAAIEALQEVLALGEPDPEKSGDHSQNTKLEPLLNIKADELTALLNNFRLSK